MGWAQSLEPDEFFCDGHHLVIMPDGSNDDFESAVADYYVHNILHRPDAVMIDSQGCDRDYRILKDGFLEVTYFSCGVEYDDGTIWEEKHFKTIGKIIEHDGGVAFKVESLEEVNTQNKHSF